MNLLPAIAAAAFAALPVAAFATTITTTNVNLRAGPSTTYPRVTTIPTHAEILTHGCLQDMSWCDVSWGSQRGWVSSRYVLAVTERRTVVVTEETAPSVGIAVVSFNHGYWERYYPARPWYGSWTVYARPLPSPPPPAVVHRGVTACGPRGCVHTGATYRRW
ncbi:SH3 domain-containing protein [Luteibacter jiangsuensis]|uniref:SH3 domain-containing protein n=1 Tax=Luteibacter jiangsuensis TaxID=637577 RepID=A0ABX0PXV7_9GAMM|nr:SH3 domain-containing protein [Luteibacter jiangsuensis]NID03341.1 SH3 domain-containing protein [Luteibacter jiangsuensis]